MTISTVPLILKFPDWPKTDQALWEQAFASGGLFSEGGVFLAWSEGTRKYHAQNYGSWLSFIRRTQPNLAEAHPIEHVNQDAVSAFIDEGRQRLKLRSVSNQILSLAVVMKGFAPERNWVWLFNAARSLYDQSHPYALKPPLPLTAADLFNWSLFTLQRIADNPRSDSTTNATHFRQALMVGLLISRPVRVRALMAMTVHNHVLLSDHATMLCFDAKDMKDKRARRIPLPIPLEPYIRLYLETYRPILLQGQKADALWISQKGNPLSIDSFTSGLALLTQRTFGLTLRPHAFRHIAATSIATYAPEHVGIIRDILGHATLRMAERHYNRATSVGVSRKFQNVLRDLRCEGHKKKPTRRRCRR
ncbi:tyrosine-type recombinase/integrase [Asticcacaulis tiandongensis]|uniref:tyrosine-type recombinase/integrase n=1 Tax=Asticcacaulis tiandongensis TaxID=2565365 RepID=UPI0011282FBD|nr:tyrosine-type recombinase/integrase [Asticcacaulis tiandongensis]